MMTEQLFKNVCKQQKHKSGISKIRKKTKKILKTLINCVEKHRNKNSEQKLQ